MRVASRESCGMCWSHLGGLFGRRGLSEARGSENEGVLGKLQENTCYVSQPSWGSSWNSLKDPLGHFGSFFAASRGLLAASWGVLERLGDLVGPLGGLWGASRGRLVGVLGASWGLLNSLRGSPSPDHSGGLLGASSAPRGLSETPKRPRERLCQEFTYYSTRGSPYVHVVP